MWQEQHSSASHLCFSFKAHWRSPEPLAGQRPLPGMLLPHLLLVFNRNTLCSWQVQMLQMVLGKVQMRDLIQAILLFIESCPLVQWVLLVGSVFLVCLFLKGLLKCIPLLSATPDSASRAYDLQLIPPSLGSMLEALPSVSLCSLIAWKVGCDPSMGCPAASLGTSWWTRWHMGCATSSCKAVVEEHGEWKEILVDTAWTAV